MNEEIMNDDYEIKDLDNLTEVDNKWLNKNITEEYKKEEAAQIEKYYDNKLNNCFTVTPSNSNIINPKLKLCCYIYSLIEKDDDVNIFNIHNKISEKANQYMDIYKNNIPLLVADIKKDLRVIHDIEITLEGLYQPIQMRVGKRLKLLKYLVGNQGEFERYSREISRELGLGYTTKSFTNYMNLSDLLDYNLSYEYYACRLEVLYGISKLFKSNILKKELEDPILDIFLDWGFNKEKFQFKPIRICEYVEFKFNKMSEFNFDPKIYLDLYKIDVPLKNDDYKFLVEMAKCGYRGHKKYIVDKDFANKYFVEIIKCKGDKKVARAKLIKKENELIQANAYDLKYLESQFYKSVSVEDVDSNNSQAELVSKQDTEEVSKHDNKNLKDLDYLAEGFNHELGLHILYKTKFGETVKGKLLKSLDLIGIILKNQEE